MENKNVLTKRQQRRLHNKVNESEISDLKSSGLSTQICFKRIIKSLELHDWYKQNPAVELVMHNGAEETVSLEDSQQVELGRNILQAAEGGSNSCIHFLEKLSQDNNGWPKNILKGIALECFVNEDKKIRIKDKHLEYVLNTLDSIKPTVRKSIIDDIIADISQGEPKHSYFDRTDMSNITGFAASYKWLRPLYRELNKKQQETSDED